MCWMSRRSSDFNSSWSYPRAPAEEKLGSKFWIEQKKPQIQKTRGKNSTSRIPAKNFRRKL
jgi:hypothetical protein